MLGGMKYDLLILFKSAQSKVLSSTLRLNGMTDWTASKFEEDEHEEPDLELELDNQLMGELLIMSDSYDL